MGPRRRRESASWGASPPTNTSTWTRLSSTPSRSTKTFVTTASLHPSGSRRTSDQVTAPNNGATAHASHWDFFFGFFSISRSHTTVFRFALFCCLVFLINHHRQKKKKEKKKS